MHCQSTSMVAISSLLAFSSVVNGAAHLRPYQHRAVDIEEREPQFAGLGGFFSQLSSALAGLTLPTLSVPGLPTTTTSKTSVVSTSSSKPVTSSTAVKSSSAAVSSAVSAKSSSVVASSSARLTSTVLATSSTTSVKASSTVVASSKSTSTSSTKAAVSSSASSKAASSSVVSKSVATSSRTSSSTVLTTSSAASTSVSLVGPSITISNGVVVGSALPGGVEQYLGIPYAQPPVGALRLKPPVALTSSFGVLNATTQPPSCPQYAQRVTGNYSAGGLEPLIDEFIFTPTVAQEDCLTISIYRPNITTKSSNYPILYISYGGGFQFGATAMYNGSNIVARSVSLGAPIIIVEVNYRLGGFGFLAGADLASETSTNLGLRDQRLGLQWVADNIAAFGGDPTKVTLWGESAGAISSCFQTTVNGGNNLYKGQALFRGTIHNSGCFAPADNVTAPQAQAVYDTVLKNAGCSGSTAAQRLACLRSVDYNVLLNATKSVPAFGSYRSADLPYLPRPDTGDTFFAQTAEISIAAGSWTKTPFIIGDQQDEGTLFAIVLNNITTSDQFVQYLASWFPGNPNAVSDVAGLVALYPDNPDGGQPDGSPYNTGSSNNVFPEYKRFAAILGDIVFIITRRAFLFLGANQGVKAWSYISSYLTGLPTYGTLHGSDLAYNWNELFVNLAPTVQQQSYYISFVNYLDPNALNSTATAVNWPLWNSTTPLLVNFTGGDIVYSNDTFRQPVFNYLLGKATSFRV